MKKRVIARLLALAGLLRGLAHEAEKRPDTESVAALRLLRAYGLDAGSRWERLPSEGQSDPSERDVHASPRPP